MEFITKINTKEFNDKFNKSEDFDFSFLVIRDNGGDNEFLKLLKSLNSDKSTEILQEISRKIEKLPKRIIVVTDVPSDYYNDNNIPNWIKKRVVFCTEEDLNKTEIMECCKDSELKNEEEYKLKLYHLWIKKRWNVSKIKLEWNAKGSSESRISQIPLPLMRKIVKAIISLETKDMENEDDRIIEFAILLLEKRQANLENPQEFIKELIEKSKIDLDVIIDLIPVNSLEKLDDYMVYPNRIIKNIEQCKGDIDLSENIITGLKKILLENGDSQSSENPEVCSFDTEGGESSKTNRVEYNRHSSIKPIDKLKKQSEYKNKSVEILYHQPTSGMMLSFNIVESLLKSKNAYNKCKIMYQLIENALLRILIVDERIARFVDQNEDLRIALENAKIYVNGGIENLPVVARINGNEKNIKKSIRKERPSLNWENNKNIYDIMVIHQGLLDDIKAKKGEIDWEKTITKWKEKIPYIVITTGRGKFHDIPNVLNIPFSILENTLSNPYHDKLILSQILMSL